MGAGVSMPRERNSPTDHRTHTYTLSPRRLTCAMTLAMAPVPTKPTAWCLGEDPKYLTEMPPAAPVRKSVMKRFSCPDG